MISPCENANPECPYFGKNTPSPLKPEQSHGCFADTDHVIPRWIGNTTGATKLLKNYIRSKANQEQLCRNDHDSKTFDERETPPAIPTERFMIDAIIRSRREAKLNGSRA